MTSKNTAKSEELEANTTVDMHVRLSLLKYNLIFVERERERGFVSKSY